MDPFVVFITRLISLLSEQGDIITTVVIAFLGFLAYKKSSKKNGEHRQNLNKRFENLEEKTDKIEKEVKTPHIDISALQAEVAEQAAVRAILHELVESSHGHRACLFKFHNGTRYYTNKHQTKMTCSVEIVKGASPIQALYQGVPVHGHPTLMEKLNTVNASMFLVKDIEEQYTLEKEMYTKGHSKAIACIPCVDPDSGLLLGFIWLSWVTEDVCPENIVFPLLKMAAHQMSSIINIPEE